MRTWISALCKSKWISLGVSSDYMLIEQTKDLEQLRFIDLEFSLFWMRQGFDFFYLETEEVEEVRFWDLKFEEFEVWIN